MAETILDFDPAELLRSEDSIEIFLAEAFASNDAATIAAALGTVGRARGMSQLAEEAGLSREHLYKALSGDGNPTLQTILAVMKALGLELTARSRAA